MNQICNIQSYLKDNFKLGVTFKDRSEIESFKLGEL